METPQSGSESLTIGHTYPISAMIGTIDPIRVFADGSNWERVEELREVLDRQLSNLDRMTHPYAGKVGKLLADHGCHPSQPFSHHGKNIIGILHTVKQEIFFLIDDIRKKAHEKGLILFEPPGGEEVKSDTDQDKQEVAA